MVGSKKKTVDLFFSAHTLGVSNVSVNVALASSKPPLILNVVESCLNKGKKRVPKNRKCSRDIAAADANRLVNTNCFQLFKQNVPAPSF